MGLTGFFPALPFVVFGLFAGAVADAFDRKKLLLVTYGLHLVPGLALGLLTFAGTNQVWQVYCFGLMGSFMEVFTRPARSAMIPRLVPRSHLMNAVTLNTMILHGSSLLGPAIAGVRIDRMGLTHTYLACATSYFPRSSGC